MQLALFLLKSSSGQAKKIFSLIILTGLHIAFLTGCSSLFFYPQREYQENPRLKQLVYKDVHFQTPDGLKLHAWHVRAAKDKRGTILFLHGNAENISTHINNVLWFTDYGYDIFAFDYRGYGRSEGRPSIEGVHMDAGAAIETIVGLTQKDNERIIILGQSLGGAVAIYSAANSKYKNNIKALVIDSAFSDYQVIAREKLALFAVTKLFQYPLAFFFADEHSPIKWVKPISPIPLLFLHGGKDTIVPPQHSRTLYNEALPPKDLWLIKNAGHIQALSSKETRERLLVYLQDIK